MISYWASCAPVDVGSSLTKIEARFARAPVVVPDGGDGVGDSGELLTSRPMRVAISSVCSSWSPRGRGR